MNFKVLMVLLCFVAGNVHARQVITGKVINKETSNPVEAVGVDLLQLPDSSVVESVTTGAEGSFMFYKVDTTKRYCISIKHLSYKPLVLAVAKKAGMINNVGAVGLEPKVLTMKEVVVAGSKVKVTELPDRTVYAIPDGFKKTSTDGLDVLRKIPSVQVDYFNENITVEGKTNIKIEVDGVTRDKEYLKKLHPSQVDKMEVITSPSGKYDAEVDAVINIITNKEMRYGLKGSFNANVLPNSNETYMVRQGANIDYGLEKISYYVAENGALQKFASSSNMERISDNIFLNQNGHSSSKSYNGNINTGFIYNPTELNNLNFNVSYNGNQQLGNGTVTNYQMTDGILDKKYQTIPDSKSGGGGLNTSLYFKHKFDKKSQHNVEFETNYYNSLNNNFSNSSSKTLNYVPVDAVEPSDTSERTEITNTRRQSVSGQANYTLPFDSVYTLGSGVNTNYNVYNIGNERIPLVNVPNLDYTDWRGWLFVELSRTFKTGNVKIGSRVETSHVTFNSTDHSNYISPLPYANGQYKINSKSSVKLAYTRRVIRPSSSDLNPFESVIDSLTVSRGNINLKPAYRDNLQLSYNLRYGKSKFTGNLVPQVFYEYRTGIIQRVTSVIAGTNRVEKVPYNISNGYETGAGISVNSQVYMILFNSYFRYSYNHIDQYITANTTIPETNKKGWNWNSYVMSPLPYKMNVFAVFNMNSPTTNGQEETKSSAFYLLGVVKQFENNSSLRVMFLNPFANKMFDNTSTLNSAGIYQRTESYLNMRNAIMLNYTYTFKIGKNINLQKRNGEQDSEDTSNKLPF
jgi:hypothetical protein